MKGKKVLVLGMKTSGISSYQLLSELGARPCFYDDYINNLPVCYENVTGMPIEKILKNLSLIVVSPAIANNHPILVEAVKKNIKIVSELELGSSYLDCKKIVVTGTNGKTTTVSMIYKILCHMGYRVMKMGNIGYPVSQVVLDRGYLDFAIIEASSFQLEHIKTFHADIAVMTNLAPDHMDRYAEFSDYIEAKKRIFENQNEDDIALINCDDKNVAKATEKIKAQKIYYSVKEQKGNVYIKDNYYFYEDRSLCRVKEARARGEHNKYNLLCAMNVAALLGARREHLISLVKDYAPLAHRIEYVTTVNGKSYYNDSKGTNIHACLFAIESVGDNIGLIMGGSDKNEDYYEFFDNLNPSVKYVTVTGGNADRIIGAALKVGYTNISVEETLADCIRVLSDRNDIANVLFSPSAASFDRYSGYTERGEAFKRLVYEVKN